MEYERIKLGYKDEIAYVTLNRPEVRNALDERMIAELEHAFTSFGKSPKDSPVGCCVRAVVLRGAGKAFCAGADINMMREAGGSTPDANRKAAEDLAAMLRAIDECPMPVLGRVQGGIYGGGLGLVAACDIVVAEQGGRMCFSECRLGIIPAVISPIVLPKIGPGNARRFYLTGEFFDMETARDIGLVHEVVPESELDEKLDFLIKNILRNGPQAVRLAKEYIREVTALAPSKRGGFSVDALMKARSSREGKEGLAAFIEKRAAAWVPVTERP